MSGLLVVLPVIDSKTTDICIESVLMEDSAAGFEPEDILIVDNSRDGFAPKYGLRTYRDTDGHNLGTSRSWNIGAREVLERNLDYLVIMSASMRFGPAMHTKWTWQMKTFWESPLIESEGHSFHLIAIHRRVFDMVGFFDENFYPGYFEAVDYDRRFRLCGIGGWPRAWVNALSQGTGLTLPLINCPAAPLLAYYKEKWGGDKGEEIFNVPFGDKPMNFWEPAMIPELAEKYQLGERGVGWW